jgi:hypothetical protein
MSRALSIVALLTSVLSVGPEPVPVAMAGTLERLFERAFSFHFDPSRAAEDEPARAGRAGLELSPLPPGAFAFLPAIRERSADAVTSLWAQAKALGDPAAQLLAVSERGLVGVVADDLWPATRLQQAFARNLRRRDTYRERIFARAELLVVLDRASELLAEREPGAVITVGDIAHAAGGQIPYGAKVDIVTDDALAAPVRELLQRGARDFERVVSFEVTDPALTFPDERWRFPLGGPPMLIERALVAAGLSAEGALRGRIETRRFLRGEPIAHEEAEEIWKRVTTKLKRARKVDEAEMVTGGSSLWRTRWIYKSQLIALYTDARVLRRPDLSAVHEIRTATLEANKPGVLLREKRYPVLHGPDQEVLLTEWSEVYEATHVSHMTGLDVDLSYVTYDPRAHFSRTVSQVDPRATRVWLQSLVDAADERGVAVDKMFMDRTIIKRLESDLERDAAERELPFWSYARPSKGHDSHVHIRLRPAPDRVSLAPAPGAESPPQAGSLSAASAEDLRVVPALAR